MKRTILFILLLAPAIIFSQLKFEGLYPTDGHNSGYLTLVLHNNDSGATGYTSFQVIDSNGDTITENTGPNHFLPHYTKMSYQLKLRPGISQLEENFCGTLILENPSAQLDFCLNNKIKEGVASSFSCDKLELTDVMGRQSNNEITILISGKTDDPNGFTTNTSFQLFDDSGELMTLTSEEKYSLPIYITDTIAYNLDVIDELSVFEIDFDSTCFTLKTQNPECTLEYCNVINSNNNLESTNEFLLYPNPVSDILHVKGSQLNIIKFYTITGQMIKQEKWNPKGINVSNLNEGVYLVKLIHENGTSLIKKIIKG